MERFPYNSMEEDLFDAAVEGGIDDGGAKSIARSLSRAVWEISSGLAVSEKEALRLISKVAHTPTYCIMLLPSLNFN